MRKLYFFIFLLLAAGTLSAQEKLSKEEQARRQKNIDAANPFKQFGYKAKVATLSKGKYLEVHDLDSIVTIGSIRFHVDRKEIVGNATPDTINGMYARPIGDMPSRWLSPDPLSEEFTQWSPYTFSFNNPIRFVDPDGRAPLDHYIDNQTGKYLGSDGAATNNYRLVDSRDFNSIKTDNGGSTTTAQATTQLQDANVSKVITINDSQIQTEIQSVSDLSRTVEHQTYIVLDRNTAEVKAERGQPGTDGLTTMSYSARKSQDGVNYNTTAGGNLLLGQVHGHNLLSNPGLVNVPGTSQHDVNSANSSGVTVYSIDAYNTPVGGTASMNSVTPSGTQTNGIGTTRGATGTGTTVNVGETELKRWSGTP